MFHSRTIPSADKHSSVPRPSSCIPRVFLLVVQSSRSIHEPVETVTQCVCFRSRCSPHTILVTSHHSSRRRLLTRSCVCVRCFLISNIITYSMCSHNTIRYITDYFRFVVIMPPASLSTPAGNQNITLTLPDNMVRHLNQSARVFVVTILCLQTADQFITSEIISFIFQPNLRRG